jgi:hypothetical protein
MSNGADTIGSNLGSPMRIFMVGFATGREDKDCGVSASLDCSMRKRSLSNLNVGLILMSASEKWGVPGKEDGWIVLHFVPRLPRFEGHPGILWPSHAVVTPISLICDRRCKG